MLNDGMALAALDDLHRRGLRVPEDIAIIGMGDLRMTRHHAIGLSSMREPLREMGRDAAEAAMKLIADGTTPVHQLITCNELHARRTTLGKQWDLSRG